jgi:hypothetical protein
MADREKVITDVEEAIKILGKVDEPTFWLDFVRVAVENALKLLKGPTVSGWVSVNDRLPEDTKQKIVFHKRGVSFAYFSGNYWWSSIGGRHSLDTVTHWMSLPEPPEEDNA